MKKIILAAFFITALGGCAQQAQKTYSYNSRAITPPVGGPTSVNRNWSKNCTEDKVKAIKRCFVGTFGDMVGSDGNAIGGGYGKDVAPFQVVYINDQGPYLKVGHNSFPGRLPSIRVGDGSVIEVDENQVVSSDVIDSFKESSYLLASYNVWPEGRKDMRVDLSGIEEALGELEDLIN